MCSIYHAYDSPLYLRLERQRISPMGQGKFLILQIYVASIACISHVAGRRAGQQTTKHLEKTDCYD